MCLAVWEDKGDVKKEETHQSQSQNLPNQLFGRKVGILQLYPGPQQHLLLSEQ